MHSLPRIGLLALGLAVAVVGCGDDNLRLGAGGRGGGGAGGLGGGGGGAAGTSTDGIVVDTPSGRIASESVDGYCDILEAVAAASAAQTVNECANPKGSNRIILTGGASYPTGKSLRFAVATSPNRPFRIEIADGTTGRATLSAADPWLLDPGDPPTSCLVHASGGALVELTDVTLTAAPSLALSGICLTRGSVSVRRARVTGFRRGGMIGTCLPETGCDFEQEGAAMLQVNNSLIDGNSTDGDGGGAYSVGFGATLVVYQSSIVNNTAAQAGGGLYFGGGWNTHIIQASTVSGNRASTGGGVMVKFACSNTYLNVFNSTIADNTAHGSGGGIQFEPASALCSKQDVTVYSSIIAGNHSATTFESNINASWWTPDPLGDLGIFTCNGGSFIYVAPGHPLPMEIDAPCFLSTRDPGLGPLMSMGGVGALPVHPLLSSSPAIDYAPTDEVLDDQRDGWIPFLDPPLTAPWTLFDRQADGNGDGRLGSDLGAVEMNPRWQTELLAVAAQGASPHQVITQPAGLDRGAGTEYAAKGATNEFVTYRLPIAEPGYYDLTAGILQTPTGGKFQIAVASDPNGPWTDLGVTQDGYAPSPTFAALGPLPTPLFANPGEKLVRFTVAGRSAASSGHRLSLDYLDARRSTKACSVLQLAAGMHHTCALTTAGGVRCWGGNDLGQLGDGTLVDRWRVPAQEFLGGVSAIASGMNHTCAVTTTGGLQCWGANGFGQLGDGTTTDRHVPAVAAVLTGVKAIAAGTNHTCALMTAGGMRCWGANDSGQLGDGTTTARHTPPAADVLTGVKAIAAGGAVTCALMSTDGVRCWGDNTFGQLGDGTTTNRPTPPVTDVIAGVKSLSVASGHPCVVTTAGGVRCWGHNGGGELGNGTFIGTLVPPATDVLSGAREVAAAPQFTCALTVAGGVRCWGYNSDGQIGDDTPNATERLEPASTDILGNVRALTVGFVHVCALMTSGGVRCWGANVFGQLGDGLVPDAADTPPPVDLAGFAGTCP